MKCLKHALLGASLMLAGASTQAHLLFPAQTDNHYAVKFWADDHWEKVLPEHVIGLRAYKDGKATKVGFNYANGQIDVPEKNVDMMTAEYDFGFYSFTKDKAIHEPRSKVKGFLYDTRHIYKMGKGIFKWNEAYAKPVGMKIEVTPLENPLKLKVGDTLKVLVTYNGKPAQQVEFEDQNSDIENLTTNDDGIASIKITKPRDGYEILGASVKLPYQLDSTQSQTLQLTGVLAFPLAE